MCRIVLRMWGLGLVIRGQAIHFRGFAVYSGNVAHMVSLGGCLWELTVLANLYRNCAANLH
jgi:hypothetical protein